MSNPGHILPPNPDDIGWEDHEAPAKPEEVGTQIASFDDRIAVNRAQDVEPILDRVKELARTDQAWSPSREMLHLAEFPFVIVEQYCNDNGVSFKDYLADPVHAKRMIADPALRDFLVWRNVTHKSYN